MNTLKKTVPIFVFLSSMLAIFATPAHAALLASLEDFQRQVLNVAIPISGVILIYAGIKMMQGDGEAVKNALIGLIFVYASAGIVIFVSSIFG